MTLFSAIRHSRSPRFSIRGPGARRCSGRWRVHKSSGSITCESAETNSRLIGVLLAAMRDPVASLTAAVWRCQIMLGAMRLARIGCDKCSGESRRYRMIPLLPLEESKRRAKEVGIDEQFGALNVFRAFLHNPTVAAPIANYLTTLLFRGKLDARIRELIILRIG